MMGLCASERPIPHRLRLPAPVARCDHAGSDAVVSQAQCQTLVASADVSDLSAETALEAMARLGLQFATDGNARRAAAL